MSLFALLFVVGSANAQTVLTTTSPSPNYTYVTGTTATQISDFITFTVRNDNPCPAAVTGISMFHAGGVLFSNGRTVSANDSSYNLYISSTNLTAGPTPVTTGNGWNFVANSGAKNTGTTNGITSLFTGVSVTIPANATMRFLIHCTDTMVIPINSTPLSFSQDGFTLFSGSATTVYTGSFNSNISWNSFSLAPAPASLNFEGSVTIIQLPPTPPIADIALKPRYACIGEDVTLKATHPKPGGEFTWRNTVGQILAKNTTGTFTLDSVTPAMGGRYYVTYTLCGAESARDSVTLIISDPPAPTIDGKLDYCLNEQFQPVIVNGGNPKWYYTPEGGSPVPVTPTINTSSPNTLIYYVSQTDQYGCESRTRTLVRLRAAKKPFPPIVSTPIYYCEEAEADQLYAFGDTLRWYYFPVGGIETQIAPTPNTSVNAAYDYYVTQTIDGCESDRSRIDVIVTFKPNGIVLSDKDQICAEDSIEIGYFGSADSTSQYNWILPPKGTTILSQNGDKTPIRIRLDSAGKYKVALRVGHTGCLSDEYSTSVNVLPLPYGRISFKQDVCLGQPELMEALSYTPGLDTFMWDFDGGLTAHFATEQGPYGVFWPSAGEKIVKLTMVDDGCVETIFDTITVHPKPSAKILATQQVFVSQGQSGSFQTYPYAPGDTMCASDSLKVTVEVVEPGATYKWTPTRFFDTNDDKPVTYARVDFSRRIHVEVEDIYGCINEDSLDVYTKSCCEMTFPNVFTPNNDGRNDLFRPITIGRREIKTFRIVNRYGQAVYESKTGGGIGWGWNGMFEGKPADVGTYFYLISFTCDKETVDQAGEVVLMR